MGLASFNKMRREREVEQSEEVVEEVEQSEEVVEETPKEKPKKA